MSSYYMDGKEGRSGCIELYFLSLQDSKTKWDRHCKMLTLGVQAFWEPKVGICHPCQNSAKYYGIQLWFIADNTEKTLCILVLGIEYIWGAILFTVSGM